MFKKLEYNDYLKIMCVMFCILILYLILGVCTFIDFYDDYKCSTASDMKWYIEHDCQRYIR